MSTPHPYRLHSGTPREPTVISVGVDEEPVVGALHVQVRPQDGRDVVVLAGELDLATTPKLRSTIGELLLAGRNCVVVDLDAVTFVDAAAMAALVTATSAVALSGGTLHLTHNLRLMLLLQLTFETHRVNVAGALGKRNGREVRVP